MTRWGVGDAPEAMDVMSVVCQADKSGNAEVTAVVENRTKKKFIISTQQSASAFFGDKYVSPSYIETSLGNMAPFLIINDGAVFWIRYKTKIPSEADSQNCLVHMVNGNFVIAKGNSYWQSAPEHSP